MLVSLPAAMNNSRSAHVGQKREKEESNKTVMSDDDDDENDGKERFDDDEDFATLLNADFQMGQQLILSIKQLSESNKRLKAENEKLKLDVQIIQRGLEAFIYTKQDLLVTKSSGAIDSETDDTTKNKLPWRACVWRRVSFNTSR